jgi:hypothetical protein
VVLDKEKLINEGYLSFNLNDIDTYLHNELYNNFNKSNKLSSINRLRYDCTIEGDLEKFSFEDYCKNLKDKFNLSDDSKFEHYPAGENKIKLAFNLEGEYEYLSECKKEIDKFKENHKDQSWLFSSPNPIISVYSTIEQIYKKILNNLYPEHINENFYFQNGLTSFDLTLYQKNDFIVPHSDGIDPKRLCVILIYLNDDYQEGYGGELIIENHTKVAPIFGNVTILDFTANNPIHSVNKIVYDDFKRFAFLKFFFKEKTK